MGKERGDLSKNIDYSSRLGLPYPTSEIMFAVLPAERGFYVSLTPTVLYYWEMKDGGLQFY